MFNSHIITILTSKVDDIYGQIRQWWGEMETLRKKVNGLYKKDYHNTERPKVDILSDTMEDRDKDLWDEMGKLIERVGKLENKK